MFEKRYFRQLPDNWTTKTQNDNCVRKHRLKPL